MNKYQPLKDHLQHCPTSKYAMKFSDIEGIIGDKLPPSAFNHRAWWSNNPNNSVMTKAWLDAGWISSNVDLEGQKLVFRRAPAQTAAKQERTTAASQPHTGKDLTISGLSADTMSQLQIKAELTGRTIEHIARNILTENVRLTTAERLALADQIRTAGPQLHQLDVPSMIRQDRDAR